MFTHRGIHSFALHRECDGRGKQFDFPQKTIDYIIGWAAGGKGILWQEEFPHTLRNISALVSTFKNIPGAGVASP